MYLIFEPRICLVELITFMQNIVNQNNFWTFSLKKKIKMVGSKRNCHTTFGQMFASSILFRHFLSVYKIVLQK